MFLLNFKSGLHVHIFKTYGCLTRKSLILGQGNLAIPAFVVAGIALLIFAFAIWRITTPGIPEITAVPNAAKDQNYFAAQLKWKRVIARLPEVNDDLEYLSQELHALWEKTKVAYKSVLECRNPRPKIDTDRIRIAVFLPDVQASGNTAQVCELFIPP